MRVWVGKEMEGVYTGDLTMFVESSIINTPVVIAINMFIDNYSVVGLYLGAGRVDITDCDLTQLYNILELCNKRKVHVTYELSSLRTLSSELIQLLVSYKVLIIFRTDIASTLKDEDLALLITRLVVKLDNGSSVLFSNFKLSSTVDVTTVNNGLYNGVDKLIYIS